MKLVKSTQSEVCLRQNPVQSDGLRAANVSTRSAQSGQWRMTSSSLRLMLTVFKANGRVLRGATSLEFSYSFMGVDIVQARSAAIDAWYRRPTEPQRCVRLRSLTVWHLSILSRRRWTMRLQHGASSARRELPRLTLRSAVTVPGAASPRH